ncbi:unnamed protein product [Withania somnifera]
MEIIGCSRINWTVMVILWLLASQVKTQDQPVSTTKIYGCWGGCYNNCFLLQKPDNDSAKTYQCYFSCLNNCTSSTLATSSTSSPIDFDSFCKGGCYLMTCIPLSFVGANVGDCLGSCGNLCKFISTFRNMQLKN